MIHQLTRLGLQGVALLVVLGLGSSPAQATNYWKNSAVTPGNWSTGNNWSPTSAAGLDNAGTPTIGEAVNIVPTDGMAHTVIYDVSAPSLGALSIDLTGLDVLAATLSMPSNNSLTANGIFVGGYSGAGVTSGRGSLNQSAGTVTTSPGTGDLVLGFGAGSNGFYTLSGGALVTGQNQYVGFLGTGTFTHTAGSNTINASAAGFFSLGRNAGSTGTYNLSGAGALVANTSEYIGHGGTGVFNQTGGTNTISGAGNSLYLGFGASGPGGVYNLSDGTLTAPTVFVGYAGAGPSNFLITGAGSRVNATNLFVVGRAGGGTLTLADGGTLAIGNGTGPLQISTVAGNSGNVRIGNGGAAGVLQASAVQFGQPGELEFNHTGNLTFATPISGPGSVFKFGLGTTTLSGTNSYRGISYVNGGTLAISSDGNLGEAPGSFNSQHFQFDGGTLRATQSFTMAATRGIEFSASGGTIEVDATKTLTYPNNLQLAIGKMNKTGAGALSIGDITVGANPPLGPFQPAELLVTGGGVLGTGFFHLGDDNETGTATISGPGTTVTNTYAWVGFSGAGYLYIMDGGTMNTAVDGHVARQFGTGIATVRGVGSTWTLGNDLHVIWAVDGAIGVLNIEDQALVYVGNTLNNDGATINLSGGTLRFNNYLEVNDGAFNFNSGAIQLAGSRSVGTDAAIAQFFGATPLIPTGKGLTVEGTGTLSKTLTINGGTFKANSLVIGAGGALNFDRGVLELTGGTITGLASLVVPANGELRASGVQALRITGAAGSAITATGNLTLGNAAAVNGFYSNGTLSVGANVVTLNDANDAAFDTGSLATLGNAGSPGTLSAANGLTLDFGGNFTGVGILSTPNNVAKPLTNNGHITGNSASQRLTLTGYVKGVGTFDNVIFTGTFAPGLSPTSLIVGNVALSPTSTLVMELGGMAPGSGYDQLQSSAALAFDGTLQVTLINGFSPVAGQAFNLFDWAGTSGTFDALQLPTLAGALAWNTSQLYTTGVLSVTSLLLDADFDEDGDVDGDDLARWRTNFGTGATHMQGNADGDGDVDGGDFLVWQRQLGSPASAGAATAVPEPATIVLTLSVGLSAVAAVRSGRRRRRVLVALALVGLCAAPARLHAYSRYWIDSAGGAFTDAGNWSEALNGAGGATVPNASDIAYFELGAAATYTVRFPGRPIFMPLTYVINVLQVRANNVMLVDSVNLNELPAVVSFAYSGPGTTSMVIGTAANSPVVTTTLAHLQSVSAVIGIGTSGGGTLNVNAGVFTLTGAAGVSEELKVGAHGGSGQGTLNVNNGADVNVNGSAPTAHIGNDGAPFTGSLGSINVSGNGSTLAIGNQGKLYVGSKSPGALNVLAGGDVTDGEGIVGSGAATTGAASVDGVGSTWTNSGDLSVGYAGGGTLDVGHGGHVFSNSAYVGRLAGSEGMATVDGVGTSSTWTNTGVFYVGHLGAGEVTVAHGGQITSSLTFVGNMAGSHGAVTVDVGSTWANAGAFYVGFQGAGALNILGGGQLTNSDGYVGLGTTSASTAVVDGAGSKWTNSGSLFVGSGSPSTLMLTNGGAVAVGGTLVVGGQGSLQGNGLVTGNVQNGNVVAPGASAGVLNVDGDFAQTASGKLQIQLGGTAAATGYDQLLVTGDVALDGTLQVTLIAGFVPAANQSFNILDGANFTGTFATIQLPALTGLLTWDTSQLATTGLLRVGSSFLTGDFDENGIVSAADLTVWKSGFGISTNGTHVQGDANGDYDIDGDDFLTWQRQLGAVPIIAAFASVPEPCALMLLWLTSGAVAIHQAQRR